MGSPGRARQADGPTNAREGILLKLLTATFLIVLGILSGVQAADSIKIGVVNRLTGSFAESGRSQVKGLPLVLEAINKAGGILGRPVELRIEDNQSTHPGTVLAFS